MNKLLALIVFSFALICTSLKAQDTAICYLRDPDGRIREHNVDFQKMTLTVNLQPKQGKVIGNVKYDFKPIQYYVDTLFLNAPGIIIKSVLVNGTQTRFDTNAEGVTIRFSSGLNWNFSYKLEINYEATPRKGIYFLGWNVDAPNTTNNRYFIRKQVWTQGQGTDNRYWIPCYDDVNDKMLTETYITFDSAYTVISNGELKEKKANANGTATWHYAMNHPMVPYLVMIGIDKYAHKDYLSKNGITSRQYYYANLPQTEAPTYQYSAQVMDWLSNEFGVKYPWPSYANVPVEDFMYGAMENTTATIYGDFYLNDSRGILDRPYYGTNAHELTHQWFGDYITEYSAKSHWLHESFATYYSKQFLRSRFGEDYYESVKRGESNSAINADSKDRFPVADSRGGSARHYPKGSFVIDMLRYVVGDSVYRKCITNYLLKHAYNNVSNNDFMMAFMETAGVNLDWFFDEWVYRSGVPNYEVSYAQTDSGVIVYVSQTHKTDELTGLFTMPIVFEAHYKDGRTASTRQWISHATDTVFIRSSSKADVSFVLFDPGSNILKSVTFNKTLDELKSQAAEAKHMIDRYDALVQMQSIDIDLKRDFLIDIYGKNTFHGIKNEILTQLAADNTQATLSLFKTALHSHDFLVRRHALDKMNQIPDSVLTDAESLLQDSSYITVEAALRKLVRLYPANSQKYFDATANVYGLNNNVRITWLELQAKKPTDSIVDVTLPVISELTDFISDKYEFRTRVMAMNAVERLNYCNDQLIRNLFSAYLSSNGRLGNPARNTLKFLFKKPENRQLAQTIYETGTWKDWEKPIIEKVLEK
jgi:aminopeptidase N